MNKITEITGQCDGPILLSELSPGEIGHVNGSLYIMRAASTWMVGGKIVYGMRLSTGEIWFANPIVTRVIHPIKIERS